MSDKKLIIGSSFSPEGIQGAASAIKKLKTEVEAFNKVFKQMSNPANLKAQGLYSKELINSSRAMRDLNKFTGDGSKLIKDKFVRSLSEEKKMLQEVESAMQRVNKAYGRRSSELKEAIASGDMSRAGTLQKGLAKGQDTMLGLQAQRQEIKKTLDAMQDSGIQQRMVSILGAVAAGATVVQQGAELYQRGKTLGEANIAASYGPASRISGNLIGGNFNSLAAIADPKSLQSLQNAGGQGAYNLGTGAGILAKIAGGAVLGAAAGSPFVGIGAIPGAIGGGLFGAWSARSNIQDFFMGGGAAKEGQTRMEQLSNLQGENFFRDQLLSDLEANAAGRLGTMRQLGGRGAMFSTMGAGLGIGTTGDVLSQGSQFANMVGPEQSAKMMRSMFGMQRGEGGFNLSSGASMGLLSGLSMGTGGVGSANETAINVMSTAFERGLRNSRVADDIGQAVGNVVSGSSSEINANNPLTTALANLPGVIQQMFGREMNKYDTAHLGGALKANESVLGAGGAFGAGRLGLAAGLVGKSSFGGQRMGNFLVSALGQMSAKDLLTNNTSVLTDLVGPGHKEEIMDIFNKYKKGAMQQAIGFRFKSDPTGPRGVIDRILKGEDISTVLKNSSADAKNQFSAFLKVRLNEKDVGLEESKLLTGIYSELGGTLSNKKRKSKDFGGSVEQSYLVKKGQIDITTASEEGKNKEVKTAIDSSLDVFKNTAAIFKSGSDAAEKMNIYMEALVKTMQGVSEKDVDAFIHKALNASAEAEKAKKTATEKTINNFGVTAADRRKNEGGPH